MDGAGRGDGVVFREAVLVLLSCPGVCVVGGGVARNIASMSAVGLGVASGVEVGWGVGSDCRRFGGRWFRRCLRCCSGDRRRSRIELRWGALLIQRIWVTLQIV